MSVKRYDRTLAGYPSYYIIAEQEEGGFVLHTDYAALESRCDGLERERDALLEENKDLQRKRIEDAARHERDSAWNEFKAKNDDLCERRANQMRKLIMSILSGKEAQFIGELESARDRYFNLGMKQSNEIEALTAERDESRDMYRTALDQIIKVEAERDALKARAALADTTNNDGG